MSRLKAQDPLTVGEVAARSGFAPSALRFYEKERLIDSSRTSGGQRRYERQVLRRLAFIRAARNIGLSLDEVREVLDALPQGRTPTVADWSKVSRAWRSRLDDEIDALVALRDRLESCIGCGCLSLRSCQMYNQEDRLAALGPGANRLPKIVTRDAP